MNDLCGITVLPQSKLLDWKVILDRWTRDLVEIAEYTNSTEIPYVHAEHANTTQLAISAAKAGYVAIRELMGGMRGENAARLDLCLGSDHTVDLVEAKFVEFDFGNEAELQRAKAHWIPKRLNEAAEEVRSYSNSRSQLFRSKRTVRRVAVTYVCPFVRPPTSFVSARLKEFLDHVRDELNPDLLSWVFPEQTRELGYWDRVHPGVILIAKSVVTA